MSTKFGFPALTNRATNLNKPKNFTGGKTLPLIVRVTDIVLDENHPLIKNGNIGLNSLGMIIGAGTNPNNFGKIYRALPSNPNTKKYPIINEHVELFQSTTPNSNSPQFFYKESLGLFGTSTPNGNQFPSTTQNITPPSQNLNYTQVEAGASNIIDNQPQILPSKSPTNPSQANFTEQSNIQPLMPFEGHIMYEGRFGNSLRFGSTSKSLSLYANNWSSVGNNGDPITILRNGQSNNTKVEGWIPTTENIRNDLSSIYLTSTQKLQDFKVASELYNSYSTPPISPSQFINPQIAINSDRIVINAKTDSILLSSQKSIGFSTNGTINMDTKSFYISSNDIKLGSKNATEPVLKGDTTVEMLKQLTKAIKDLATILEVDKNWPGGSLQTGYNAVAGNVILTLNDVINQLNDGSLKSKTTKVQ
jgi:hypothetical protein